MGTIRTVNGNDKDTPEGEEEAGARTLEGLVPRLLLLLLLLLPR